MKGAPLKKSSYEVQTQIGHARKSLSVTIPMEERMNPWPLLSNNFWSSIRYGLLPNGHLFLGVDIPSEESAKKSKHWESELLKTGERFQENGKLKLRTPSLKPTNPDSFLHDYFAEHFGENLMAYSMNKRYDFYTVRFPMFFFNNENVSDKDDLDLAPAYYGLFLNTRIHFCNFYYTQDLGWGLSLHLYNSLGMERAHESVKRFGRLVVQFKKEAWTNIMALYDTRLAGEFKARSGYYPKVTGRR